MIGWLVLYVALPITVGLLFCNSDSNINPEIQEVADFFRRDENTSFVIRETSEISQFILYQPNPSLICPPYGQYMENY